MQVRMFLNPLIFCYTLCFGKTFFSLMFTEPSMLFGKYSFHCLTSKIWGYFVDSRMYFLNVVLKRGKELKFFYNIILEKMFSKNI